MRFWPTRRRATTTRMWITVTAARVDPAALLEQVAAAHAQPTLESISFDGESAAVELRLTSVATSHAAQEFLAVDADERVRLVAVLETLHADPTVQDLLLESHVGGDEHVAHVAVVDFNALVERVRAGQLRAGVRYVSD